MLNELQLAQLISTCVAQQLSQQRQQQFATSHQQPFGASPSATFPAAITECCDANTKHQTLDHNNQSAQASRPQLLASNSSAGSTAVQRSRPRLLSRSTSGSSRTKKRKYSNNNGQEDGETTAHYSASTETETETETEKSAYGKVSKPKRRRRRETQLSKDKKFIAPAVIEAFDEKYLKPRISPLFRRMLKRTTNPDGTRSLKKNPDIVISLFKILIRPVLRNVLG